MSKLPTTGCGWVVRSLSKPGCKGITFYWCEGDGDGYWTYSPTLRTVYQSKGEACEVANSLHPYNPKTYLQPDVVALYGEDEPPAVSESSKPLPTNLHELADLASHGVEAAQNELQSLGKAVGVDVEECENWEHAAAEIEKQQKRRKKKSK